MIIEDDTHYELMGVSMQVRRSAHRVAQFIASYHSIRSNETHDELQKDLMEEWWKWKWTTIVPTYCILVLFQKLYCIIS
jgi:hypothetical protein